MESLSMQLQPFFEWLLRTTLQASLLICLILLFQVVLRSRLGARWHYCLWLLLLIRMAMPWAPQSRVSVFNLIPQSLPQRQTEYIQQDVGDYAVSSDAASPSRAESTLISTTGIPQDNQEAITATPQIGKEAKGQLKPVFSEVADILPLIWLTGTLALAFYVCASNFNLLRIVKRERPLTNQKILDLLEDCKAEMGIRIILGVVATDKVKSPALFGFIRPRLLLPKGMLEILSREELRYVFLHELAHLKRHDIYIGWLMSLLQVLHWFNPLIWLAFYRLRADRELACDALVLARTQSGQAKDYGRTIVNLLERFSRSQRLPAMAGILETKAQLKRRIIMIARFKNKSYQWSPLAVILIIILACVSLPDAKRTKASETAAGEPVRQPNFRKIWIPTKPGNGVLSPDGERLAFVSEGSVWVVPVHGKVSPDIAGEPVRLTEPMGAWDLASLLAWSSDGKWIAFNTSDEKEDAIYVVRSSGGVPKKVPVELRLRNSVYNYRLSLSPDGKVVAFSSRYIEESKAEPPEEPGLPPSVRGFFIYTVPVAGGEVKRLTDSASGEQAFSPDGNKIAFVKYYTAEKGQLCGSLWVVPAAGGSAIQVSDSDPRRRVGGPVWSPDGKMIAFTTRTASERKEVCIVPVSETGKALTSPTKIELPLNTLDILAGWTPDNKIGVFLDKPGHWAIYTVPASGGEAVQVTPSGWATHPQWSPDGERIYFRWGGGAIASVPSHGGKLSIVRIQRDPPVGLVYPGSGNAVSPDGKEIVFCGGGNIHTVPVGGGEPKKITQGRYPCWSPDGKSIAFIRSHQRPTKRESGWNIYIIPSKGGDVRQLTSESDNVRRTHIDWSPDGKSIAYFAKDKTIRIIPVQGGEPRIVATVEELRNRDELAWSPDGTKLVYSSKGSIWVVSPDGGEPKEIRTGLDAEAGHVSWSPDGKKLAFTAMAGGEEELWLMENFLPGAPVAMPEPELAVRRVWADAADPKFMGAPSADGKYLSYADWETGDLAVHELATGTNRLLTNEGRSKGLVGHSVFSPDSKQVAYHWWDYGKKGSELRIVALDGSGPRVLNQDKETANFPMGWTPDGTHILALSRKWDKSFEILLVPVADGPVRVLKTLGKKVRKRRCTLSPDGQYVAYSFLPSDDSPNTDISVVAVDGSHEIPLVKYPADDFVLGWAPDGKRVVFASNRTGSMGVWAIEIVDGKTQGTPQLLKPEIGQFYPLGLTQNGSFYYGVYSGGYNVYTATYDPQKGNVAAKPIIAVHRYEGSNWAPDWSPDGRYLACVSVRPGASPVFLISSVETGEVRELSPDLKTFNVHSLRWSPDGRSLLGAGKTKDVFWGVLKIDVKTGAVTTVVEGPGIFGPHWSADGKAVFYVCNLKTSGGIIRHDLATGEKKELYSAPGFISALALSPDGRQLAFRDIQGGALKVLPSTGGQPRELVKVEGKITIAWTPDGRQLVYGHRGLGEGPGYLWRISAGGGEPQKLDLEMPYLGHVRFHPDGRQITFMSETQKEKAEVWVMENFLPGAPVAKPEPELAVRRVWADGDLSGGPSPDGKYVSYIDWETGDVAVRELATGKSRRLTNEGTWLASKSEPPEYALIPKISPNGKQVAYTWCNKDYYDLRVVNFDGSNPRVIYRSKTAYVSDWSPDGKHILATLHTTPPEIVSVSVADDSIRLVKKMDRGTVAAGVASGLSARISPDGRYLAYSSPSSEDSLNDIFLIRLKDNTEIPLVTGPADDHVLGWTPDSRRLLFAGKRNGTWDAWLIRVADGKPAAPPQLVKPDIGTIKPMGFTRNGSFYYGVQFGGWQVYIGTLDVEKGEVVAQPAETRFLGRSSHPAWSPDGKYLAYNSVRPGEGPKLAILSVETGEVRTLAPKLNYLGSFRWSPDGRSFVAGAQQIPGRLGICQIDARTGDVTTVVESGGGRPVCSPDGKGVFYVNGSGIRFRDLQTSGEKEILPGGKSGFDALPVLMIDVSPDGQQVAVYGRESETKAMVLKLIPVTGGEPRELLRLEKAGGSRGPLAWMPDGRHLLLIQSSPEGTKELWRIPTDGAERQKLDLPGMKGLYDLCVHPNGRRVAFRARSQAEKSEVWVIENFLPTGVSQAK